MDLDDADKVSSASVSTFLVPPTLPTHGYATVYFYPTISPRIVVIPILSCIFGFPVLVMIIICALRKRARKARLKAKRKKIIDNTLNEVSTSTFVQSRAFNEKTIKMKNGKRKTIVRFKPMPEIDLDTVVEERSEFDAELSTSDLMISPQEIAKRMEYNTPNNTKNPRRYPGFSANVSAFGRPTHSLTHKLISPNLGSVIEENDENTYKEISPVIEINKCQILPDDLSSSTLKESSISLTSEHFCNSESLEIKENTSYSPSQSVTPVKCKIIDLGGNLNFPSIVNINNRTCEPVHFLRTVNKDQFSKSCEDFSSCSKFVNKQCNSVSVNRKSSLKCDIMSTNITS